MDPPVKEFGFPAPMEPKQTLETQNMIRQVPRGTGRYVSPRYAVKKSGNRVRLVVKYCSLNDRLKAPAGVRHHSPVEWKHQLPSRGKYFSVLDVKDAFYRIRIDDSSRPFLNMPRLIDIVMGENVFTIRERQLTLRCLSVLELSNVVKNQLKSWDLNCTMVVFLPTRLRTLGNLVIGLLNYVRRALPIQPEPVSTRIGC